MSKIHSKAAFVFADRDAASLSGFATVLERWLVDDLGLQDPAVKVEGPALVAHGDGIKVALYEVRAGMARAAELFWTGIDDPGAGEDVGDAGLLYLISVQTAEGLAAGDSGLMTALCTRLAECACPDAVALGAAENWSTGAALLTARGPVRPRRAPGVKAMTPRPVPAHARYVKTPLSAASMSTRHRAPCRTKRHALQHEATLRVAMRSDEIDARLQSKHDAMTSERGVKAWTLTATTAIIAPPVGAALACSNIVAGASVRTSAHMLALSGFFVTLLSQGFVGKALMHMPI